jgi:hypothetical protein
MSDGSDPTHFDYAAAPFPIREDIPAAHRAYWAALARAGSWWTGAERVAIAGEVRRAPSCALCAERKAALSPFSVDGAHDCGAEIPPAAVDAVHRLVTDASRLSKSWLEKLASDGLSAERYVELLGVVVCIVNIDQFHRALGLPLQPLPQPVAGAPDNYRPSSVDDGPAWVPWIPAGKGTGLEADLYPGSSRTPNVYCALSLVPAAVRAMGALSKVHYVGPGLVANPTAVEPGRSLTRPQIELIAGRVSALNECFY